MSLQNTSSFPPLLCHLHVFTAPGILKLNKFGLVHEEKNERAESLMTNCPPHTTTCTTLSVSVRNKRHNSGEWGKCKRLEIRSGVLVRNWGVQ
jgi:hypothetical protein